MFICMCVHVYLPTWACMHLLTTFIAFFMFSMSEYVSLVLHPVWLIHQWCAILSSHKPHLPRKANVHCMQADQWKVVSTCKLISKTVFLKSCAYKKVFLYVHSYCTCCYPTVPTLNQHASVNFCSSENQAYSCIHFLLPSLPASLQSISFFLALLPTGGQRVCEAGNLRVHGSRLLEAFFTHQQDLPCVVLHSMVWRKVATASWPSTPWMLLMQGWDEGAAS